MDKLIRIKWASSNTPFVSLERTDERLYFTKRELVELQNELKEFIDFYKDDFRTPYIDYTDSFDNLDSIDDFGVGQ